MEMVRAERKSSHKGPSAIRSYVLYVPVETPEYNENGSWLGIANRDYSKAAHQKLN